MPRPAVFPGRQRYFLFIVFTTSVLLTSKFEFDIHILTYKLYMLTYKYGPKKVTEMLQRMSPMFYNAMSLFTIIYLLKVFLFISPPSTPHPAPYTLFHTKTYLSTVNGAGKGLWSFKCEMNVRNNSDSSVSNSGNSICERHNVMCIVQLLL